MHKTKYSTGTTSHNTSEDMTELVFPSNVKSLTVPTFVIFLDGLS